MDLVNRVKNILLDPQNEWRVIDGEPDKPIDILKNYVAIVAAIPVVCGFIGASIIGVAGFRTGIFIGLMSAIIHYVLALIGVYVIAFIIDALAPTFGGRKDFNSAFKVAAYSPTAAWIAGVFALLPILSVLTILGLYSLYLLYIGLPILMRTPPERSVPYILAVIVCAVIVWVLIFALPFMLLGMRMM
ncbi:MAG: Yip1 family protein [Alphaproteobacteria bacterium]